MKLRSFLLIGTALPLAFSGPAGFAGDRHQANSGAIVLAQADACPEGQECAAAGQTPAQAKEQRRQEKLRKQREQKAQQQQQQGGQTGSEPTNQTIDQGGLTPAQAKEQRRQEKLRKQREQQQQQQQGGQTGSEPTNQTTTDQGGLTPAQAKEQRRQEKLRKQREQKQQQQQGGQTGTEPGDQTTTDQGALTPAQAKEQRRQEKLRKQREQQQQQQQGGQTGTEPGNQTGTDQSGLTPEQAKEQRRQEKLRKQREQQQGQTGTEPGNQPGTDQSGLTPEQAKEQRRQEKLRQQREKQQQGTVIPPAPPIDSSGDSIVEQQLNAQGDQQEANKVRSLRERLRQQLDSLGGTPGFDESNPDGQDQNGDHRRRDDRDGRRNRHRDEDVVDRRDGRIIIDLGKGRLSIEQDAPDEGGRLLYDANDVEVQDLPHGRTRTIVHRDNGVDIVTVRDRYGDIIKRTKVLPDGREIVLIDSRYDDNADDQGPPPPPPILYDVPPPIIRIPQNQYIVDYGDASQEDIVTALRAPAVQRPPRAYTLDEVLQNEQVRDYAPRIDLDTITFETGSAVIGFEQMASLDRLGHAMEQVLDDNPDEVYLIEGHTDAVGSPEDNLILSDQRAEAVATALSQNYNIPPENLVTKGYGEEFLKINTAGPEMQNRRATVRRLTELMQAQNQ